MRAFLISGLVAALSLPAHADDAIFAEMVLGVTTIGDFSSEGTVGVRGGYQFTRNLTLEAAYNIYAKAFDDKTGIGGIPIQSNLEADSIDVGVKLLLPLNDSFSFIGRLGYSFLNYDALVTDLSIGSAITEDEQFDGKGTTNDIFFGMGFEYLLDENMYLSLDYARLKLETGIVGPAPAVAESVQRFSLSIGTRF